MELKAGSFAFGGGVPNAFFRDCGIESRSGFLSSLDRRLNFAGGLAKRGFSRFRDRLLEWFLELSREKVVKFELQERKGK